MGYVGSVVCDRLGHLKCSEWCSLHGCLGYNWSSFDWLVRPSAELLHYDSTNNVWGFNEPFGDSFCRQLPWRFNSKLYILVIVCPSAVYGVPRFASCESISASSEKGLDS